MVLPYINMNLSQVYTYSASWTPLPPPSLYHPSGSSQCTSPKHPVLCIEPVPAICFTYDNIHVSMPFSQIIPPSPFPTESKRLFYTSVSLLLSRIRGYCYHLSKFHIYALGDEYNCVVVWTFFGIALLWDWNENWSFPVLWLLLSFPNLLAYWVQHFHSIIFQDLKQLNWNAITSTSFVRSDAS